MEVKVGSMQQDIEADKMKKKQDLYLETLINYAKPESRILLQSQQCWRNRRLQM